MSEAEEDMLSPVGTAVTIQAKNQDKNMKYVKCTNNSNSTCYIYPELKGVIVK